MQVDITRGDRLSFGLVFNIGELVSESCGFADHDLCPCLLLTFTSTLKIVYKLRLHDAEVAEFHNGAVRDNLCRNFLLLFHKQLSAHIRTLCVLHPDDREHISKARTNILAIHGSLHSAIGGIAWHERIGGSHGIDVFGGV